MYVAVAVGNIQCIFNKSQTFKNILENKYEVVGIKVYAHVHTCAYTCLYILLYIKI